MATYLRKHALSKWPTQCLFTSLLGLIGSLTSIVVSAQTLSTEPLTVTSVCAGSQIDVPGIRSSVAEAYAVELSDGGTTYAEIPSTLFSASGRYEITYRATIPAGTPAGTNYRVRLVSKTPDVKGTPSATILTIKAKPAPPTVDALISDCQYISPSAESTSTIFAKVIPDAIPTLYNESLVVQQVNNAPVSLDYTTFQVPKTQYFSEKYVYPVKEITFYLTQSLNSCESEKAKTVLRILYRPITGPIPVNAVSQEVPFHLPNTYYGKLAYCQDDQASSLNVNGHAAPPENYQVVYKLLPDAPRTTTPPTPNTSIPSTQTYELALNPIDPTKGCSNYGQLNTRLTVTVNPHPGKPTALATSISLCQGQSTGPLSATTTADGATLVWYGTSATGGNGASVATQPATANAGTFKYYVAQKLGDCESERTEIVVEVRPTPALPTVQSIAICQNAAAPTLQPGGQNLLWYTTATGGTGSATTPVVSTSQTSQTAYYVSQSVNGCESPRATFSVTVNAVPGVPIVANAGPAYCQGSAASPLVANGQGLNWYRESSGGTSLGSTVTPDTREAGNFTFYASQTINGCEGSRSSLTVAVKAIPAAPTATSTYSYCQKTAAVSLTATGSGLKWYDGSGQSSNTSPTPSTDTPGTVSYFVTQTVDNCESPRAEIKVTTKPTPAAPGTSAFSICQNTPTQSLSASGQNLLWYTAETGSPGSATAPVVTTNQAGQTNYYVSQSLNGCESPKALLTVTVKSLPSAPGVAEKKICQFTPAESVTAMGDGLTWYTSDGIKLGSAPVINTDKGASFTLLVTQTVNGCEGPRATLVVNVLATPVPTVSKTIVEICQGTVPQPLEAIGTNLKWTDPAGNVTTIAPAPSTQSPTAKPDGDVYYVTQTGANGCESAKVAIRVFVQALPTMSITGTTTTNLGLDVPLQLLFTGVGPYRYKLSTGLTGTATKDTTIRVLPDRTTVYQVAEVANKCGAGNPGTNAVATITVLIPTIQTLALTSTSICAGASLSVGFSTSGTFNQGSVFKLQLAKVETDSTKISFVDLPVSQTATGQLTGTISTSTAAGSYWLRAIATNPKIPVNGTLSPTTLTVRPLPAASLAGNQAIYEGQPASLTVTFSGDGPWNFSYRDSTATGLGTIIPIVADASPRVVEVRPQKTTAYLLTSVSNVCGNGNLTNRLAVVTVTPLLSTDDPSLADVVEVYPVPATTTLTVHIKGVTSTEPAWIELMDESGRGMGRQESRQATSLLRLDTYPVGTYLLHIQVGDRTATKRIVKY